MKKISFIALTVLVLCLFCGVTVFASEEEPYQPKIPKIVFEEQEKIPEVEAGSFLDLIISYQNDSANSAYSIRMTPSFENIPLVYERPVVFKRDKSLRAHQKDTASFSFKVANDAKTGVYAINFKIEYANLRDENYSNEQTVYFKVSKEKIKPIITISDISTSSEVSAENPFTLSFKVSNMGEVEAENVEVQLTGLSSNTFMAQDANDYQYIGELKGKENVMVHFDMLASEEIKKGTNYLTAEIKYKDYSGNEISTEKAIYIQNVKSKNAKEEEPETTSAKPKIIISSYSTNPKTITAGNTFTFIFTFKNTSKDKGLRNMKVTLDSKEGAFIITKGSNTFYIEDLPANAAITKSIELRAKQDLTSNSYAVNLHFDYEDFNGNEYMASEIINIPVTEYSKLVINSVMPAEGYLGSNCSLSFDYINMGKATISNLTASVEGDYTSVQPINYIGNLAAGNSDYYDIEITPTKEGKNYGILVLSFEDSSGGVIEVKKDFEGYAMSEPNFIDNPYLDDPYIDEPTAPEGKEVAIWVIVLSGLGVFIVVFLITKMITTKIIRKKLEDEI